MVAPAVYTAKTNPDAARLVAEAAVDRKAAP